MAGEVAGAGLLAMLGAFFLVFVLIFIAFYVYMALALMTIAKKTNTKNAWLAWIPIANVYLMLKIAKLSGWWIFAILVAVIPFIGSLAVAAGMIYVWWRIAIARGKPGWWGILMIVPIANLIIPGLLAWSK